MGEVELENGEERDGLTGGWGGATSPYMVAYLQHCNATFTVLWLDAEWTQSSAEQIL